MNEGMHITPSRVVSTQQVLTRHGHLSVELRLITPVWRKRKYKSLALPTVS